MKKEHAFNIFLTGFMGTGKSTVGKVLAKKINWPFIDLDQVIEGIENRSIHEVFLTSGEEYFRKVESQVLKDLTTSQTIYATGGGMVLSKLNREVMRALGKIVYLKTSWPFLLKRLQFSNGRPLVNMKRNWQELELVWKNRQEYYNDADFIVVTDHLSPTQVAEQIVSLLDLE
jgi:shikimate kinase